MTTNDKAARLYERDQARLGSAVLFTDLATNWDEAPQRVKDDYYGFVAAGDYNIEFEEDNND